MKCEYEKIGERLCKCKRCGSLAKSDECDKCAGTCRKFCVFRPDPDGRLRCVRGGCNNVLAIGNESSLVECHGRRPGVLALGANFAAAVVRHVANGAARRSEAEVTTIKAICQENRCGLYNAEHGWCEHKSCGCGVEQKASWAKEVCPIGLWS